VAIIAACAASMLACRGATPPGASETARWRNKCREALLRRVVLTDGHAPSEFRAGTVRNLDPWYAAFDVKPGARLFLAPADRVRVW
jgi:predicted metalloendopeptidase